MKMKKRLLLYGGLLFPLSLLGQVTSQDPGPGIVRFVNEGKMSVAPNIVGTDTVTSLYVPNGVLMTGPAVIVQQDGITAIGGHFNNEVTLGNIFSVTSIGKFRFCGNAEQWIRGAANRAKCFIDFPNVEVENLESVSLASSMGMNTGNMNLKTGRFILRSTEINEIESQLAHLLVKQGKSVFTNTGAGLPALSKGVVEVEFALGANRASKFFGFSSPFKKMRADYFFFKVLLAPTNAGYFGSSNIQDPCYALQSGKGYFVGHDVFPHSSPAEITQYYPPITGYESSVFSDRVTEMLRLNRWHFDLTNPGIAQASGRVADAYSGEQIHTQDVVVTLEYGYNYLGNPFTAPLRMDKLFQTVNNPAADGWKITRGLEDSDNADLYAKIWVPNSANSTNHVPGTFRFTFNCSFLVGQEQGSTLMDSGNNENQVEPMQMFVVWAEKNNVKITIPASERTHGNANILKSSSYTPDDELLIQVRDMDSDAIDRFCVLFRNGASINSEDKYDASKLFNRSGGVTQIYNRTPDAEELSVNEVNTGLESMVLSLQPCLEEKEVELTAHRLETLHSPEAVLLEDLLTGEITDLRKTAQYRFTTQSGDIKERFVLHFNTPTGMETTQLKDMKAFHLNGKLKVTGLADIDTGSQIIIYDIQGRDVFSGIIRNCVGGVFETPLSVTSGVYIVKISGKRHTTVKLICK